ncbi:helix-turn-helix domain-containing protein [Streptomyces yaizuensis]|uniref:helix-turn-helix domain-containing protein n=1 Tax=Streptomyces yaizuensis TaxID=2989713 RepID=UPI002B1FF6B8|nr:helix-turn-helix transcriptional regulator [Streptomyces sp. YSPA8]
MLEAIAQNNPGAVVRLARLAAELTQAELGAATGYTAASISRMERGKQPMRDMVLLRRIAEVLGIPPQLLGLAPRHTASRTYESAPLPPGPATRPCLVDLAGLACPGTAPRRVVVSRRCSAWTPSSALRCTAPDPAH